MTALDEIRQRVEDDRLEPGGGGQRHDSTVFAIHARRDIPRLLAALDAVLELLDISGWHVYKTRDIGDAYLADSVQDHLDEIRQAITAHLGEKP